MENNSLTIGDYDGTTYGPFEPLLCRYPHLKPILDNDRLIAGFPYIDDLVDEISDKLVHRSNDGIYKVILNNSSKLPALFASSPEAADVLRTVRPLVRNDLVVSGLGITIEFAVIDALNSDNSADQIHGILDTIAKYYSQYMKNDPRIDILNDGLRLVQMIVQGLISAQS